jgi:hypothetical protein
VSAPDLQLVNLTGVGSATARRRSSPATPTPAASASVTPAGRSSSPGPPRGDQLVRDEHALRGTTGGYRIDQADDLAFLARFGITP